MQNPMPPVDTPDKAFHDGNPLTGELGTIVTALFMNNVQSAIRNVQAEVISVLTDAGIAVDPNKTDQLLAALKATFATNTNVNGRVPVTRKVNGKALSADITLTAGDVGALAKDQNGADIPNKPLFRENAGITALLNEKANSSTVLLLKGPINTADLDTLGGPSYQGRWTQGATANATIARHYPIVSAGSLDVIYNAVAGYGTVQIYTTHISNRIFVRSKPLTTDPWSDWVEVWTSANLPNPMTLDTQQTITNAKIFRSGQQPLRLVADTTGGAVFLPFYDADGTTRKGWIGRGSANNNTIQLNNDATGASIQLSDTGGINITPTSNGAIETRGLLKNVNPGFSGIALESTSIAANTVGRIFKIETSSDGLSVVFIARNGSNTTGQRTASLALPAASGNILVSNGNAVADANGSWIVPGSAGSISVNDLAGIPLPFPGAVAPAGWLKCNGQTFNKTLYPVLASRYPAGILPDLRGEFVRGWDDGRGADAGRALLSVQGDAIRNITGRLLYGYDADTGVAADADSGALHYDTTQGVRDSLYLTWATNTANLWYPAKLDASRVVPTANENRSRNVAFNYIVRAA